MSLALWLLLLIPLASGAFAAFAGTRLATAVGRAGALASAAWTTLVALEMPAGAAASVPWMPASGIELSLRVDPLATCGLLGVAWISAAAAFAERGRRLALILIGEAAVLAAWLADDLGVMAAAWAILPLVAAGLVGRSRQSALAAFLPLAAGAAALSLAAVLLALGHQEASVGTWSFALPTIAAAVLPPAEEALVAGLLLAAAWLTMGLWPLHGWWQSALDEGERAPAAALWLPALVRPLGLWILIRVAAPLCAESWIHLAPALLGGIAASAVVGLAGARGERDPRRLHHHLAHLPIAAAALGVLSVSGEGLTGALLLGLGGGLALTLAELACHLRIGPLGRVALAAGNLGLLGGPGLLGFAGLILVVPAALSQGPWVSPGAPWVALLVLLGSMAAFAPAAARAGAAVPLPASSRHAFGRPRASSPGSSRSWSSSA
ncbi:MAG: hypothetical protein H6710_08200 [Myxococcales bacterium]|nr:hypothetical protein [Myxococcales bacterium]